MPPWAIVSRETLSGSLLADAELAEHHIQQVLYINPAGQAPQCLERPPQALRHELLVRRPAFAQTHGLRYRRHTIL